MPIVKPVVFKVKPKTLSVPVKKNHVNCIKVDVSKSAPAVALTPDERSKPPHKKEVV